MLARFECEANMTRHVRTDDGVAIEFNVYGSGPLTLFFLHGWGNAASAWDDLITTRLNLAGLRCIAASYRGHEGSDAAQVGYTHERFARDMFDVASAVDAERLVMVGFSMAGKFDRYMAHVDPGRIMGQVLIAPVAPEKLEIRREAFAPWLEAAPHPARFREILLQFTKVPIRNDLLDTYCRNVSSASRAALEGTIDMFYEPIENEVRDIRIPTLIIGGDSDPLFSSEYITKRVLPTTPGARLVFLPCGHEIPFELPNETAWLLEAYVAGLRA
jgi:pimeloyl-ACP methyl ester carboxylesterase